MNRIVIVSVRPPRLGAKGDQLVLYMRIRALLNSGFPVCLILYLGSKDDVPIEFRNIKSFSYYLINHDAFDILKGLILSIFTLYPIEMRIFRNSKVVDILRNLNFLKEDRVLFCTIRSYCNLKSLLVSNVYVDLIDSYSLNYDRRSKKGLIGFINKIQSALHRYTEKKLIKLTSGVFVVSRVDAKWLNDPKVHVLNLGVSIQEKRNISIVESSTIGFLGNLNYGPNQRAVYWFVKHVLPILLKSNSQIKFLIAGNFSEKLRLPNSDNIKVIGQVKSQYDFYSTVKVSIAPLVDGSGMQNKVLEAMSVGTPVVASSIAANPLGAKDEIEIMVADTPELFADCVNTLLNNEEMANEIGLNGRFYVQNNHDWDQIDKEFIRILQIENEIDPI